MAKKGKEKNQSVGDALSLGGVRVGVGEFRGAFGFCFGAHASCRGREP